MKYRIEFHHEGHPHAVQGESEWEVLQMWACIKGLELSYDGKTEDQDPSQSTEGEGTTQASGGKGSGTGTGGEAERETPDQGGAETGVIGMES